MSREFNNTAELMAALRRDMTGILRDAEPVLHEAGHELKDRAQQKLGLYNAGWEQLSEATQDAREKAGFTRNEPLLASGKLRDAIEFDVTPGQVLVGVKSNGDKPDIGDIARWQEFGTPDARNPIPPRPFLGPTLFENRDHIGKLVTEHIIGNIRRKIA